MHMATPVALPKTSQFSNDIVHEKKFLFGIISVCITKRKIHLKIISTYIVKSVSTYIVVQHI